VRRKAKSEKGNAKKSITNAAKSENRLLKCDELRSRPTRAEPHTAHTVRISLSALVCVDVCS
jgi:hypothetical protein